jgi:hypothetical protein
MSIVKRSVQSTGFIAALVTGVALLAATDNAVAKVGGSSLGASNFGASMAPARNTMAPSPNILHPTVQRPDMSRKDVSHNDLGRKDLGRTDLSRNDRGGDRQVKTRHPIDRSEPKREILGLSGRTKASVTSAQPGVNASPSPSSASNNPLPGSVGNNNIHPIINTNSGTANNNIHPIINTNPGTANTGTAPSAPPTNTAPPDTVVVRDHRGEAPTLPPGTIAVPDGMGGVTIQPIPTTASMGFTVARDHRTDGAPYSYTSSPNNTLSSIGNTGFNAINNEPKLLWKVGGMSANVGLMASYLNPSIISAATAYGLASGGVGGAYSWTKWWTISTVAIFNPF